MCLEAHQTSWAWTSGMLVRGAAPRNTGLCPCPRATVFATQCCVKVRALQHPLSAYSQRSGSTNREHCWCEIVCEQVDVTESMTNDINENSHAVRSKHTASFRQQRVSGDLRSVWWLWCSHLGPLLGMQHAISESVSLLQKRLQHPNILQRWPPSTDGNENNQWHVNLRLHVSAHLNLSVSWLC